MFGDKNNLKAFSLKASQSCHGFVGSEFKQDYFLKEGLVCSNVFSQAVLSREHSQGAADSDGCAPGSREWEFDRQPRGQAGHRGAGLGAPYAV